ncbi:MAG: hypothetical protein AAF330_02920 [Pseudomonadota bacterium]
MTSELKLRPPAQMMRLHRLGAMHQCRLSFMRVLLRRMAREAWRFERQAFEIDAAGVGYAVYTTHGPERAYSLVAFAHDLPDEQRSDRVIATAWDATFALFDGVPEENDIARLAENVPLQEAGRLTAQELSVSRANRSARLWEHVVERLSQGMQPDCARLQEVGYLMRTTAVYGSGKLGAADRELIADRSEMAAPFQAEMLSIYLTRWFVRDLVEHMARARNPQAARLDNGLAEHLGIGNSTGLGMAPFLINHPQLFNNWMAAREEAIARVRALQTATQEARSAFAAAYEGAKRTVALWHSQSPLQQVRLVQLRQDLQQIDMALPELMDRSSPWDRLMVWAEDKLSYEGQELLASLILEPYGPLVDDLEVRLADDSVDSFRIDGGMHISELQEALREVYGWAGDIDWDAPESVARVWYVSEEKLEPRLGERFEEPVAAYEQALAPARDAAWLAQALTQWPGETQVAAFLLRHPEHRHQVRRVQIAQRAPYAEIRDNTISAEMLPIDMLRAKLSFFGVTRFDPRSDRWVRVCMYAGAPYPTELAPANADHWVYPGPQA